MQRALYCAKCGVEKAKRKMHPADVTAGWKRRFVIVAAQVPPEHGITVNDEFHSMSELVCDCCGDTVPVGSVAYCSTMWVHQPWEENPPAWETEYGTILDEETKDLITLLQK